MLIVSLPCFCNSLSVFYFKMMSNLVIFGEKNQKKSLWGSPHTPPQACLFLPVCRVACHPDRGGRLGNSCVLYRHRCVGMGCSDGGFPPSRVRRGLAQLCQVPFQQPLGRTRPMNPGRTSLYPCNVSAGRPDGAGAAAYGG